MLGQPSLFGDPEPPLAPPAPRPQPDGYRPENPCVWMFGRGPDRRTCGECNRLGKHHPSDPLGGHPKCQLLYAITHRPWWPACACFEVRP